MIDHGLGAMLRTFGDRDVVIALGDGVGGLNLLEGGVSIGATVSDYAAETGRVSVILGWSPVPTRGLRPDDFARVVSLMPGWGVRALLPSPATRAVPTSMAAIPALLSGHLRPDVLITRMTERDGVLRFCTEVSWQRALIDIGVPVWAILDDAAPSADATAPLATDAGIVVGRVGDAVAEAPVRVPDAVYEELADRVLQFVPSESRLQFGPGPLGTALLQRATKPLAIDTGLLTDGVIDLEARGLLRGQPSATYLFGSAELYQWAKGRPILRGIEHSHDLTRLSRGAPFVAVNTAIEIDPVGQINVEGVGDRVVGGIGGHPDYCTAARLNRGGVSIIAVPSLFNGHSPLVERLTRPASTPAHDVEVIVTEYGHADLRSADWSERRRLIGELFARAA